MPIIRSDPLALEQIFSNLMDNAVKYLDPSRPGKISITAISTENEYLFSIRDNGRGIAEEDLSKIFDLFRRVGKQDVPGDGMGLAYIRTILRQLGGGVWCESKLGVGTTMFFTVPQVTVK